MVLPIEWLNEFVSTEGIDIKSFCDRMTATGSKVEGYEQLGADIENVVAGKVLSVVPHPDSDHMVICMIDCGEEKPRQIVTGAQNVTEGAMVPVCRAPAKLPGGIVIKKGKLRGVESDGMLCSIAELGLTKHDVPYAAEDGILLLQEPCVLGDDIRDVLRLSDTAVEFEITPNRPDCLSVIGLAREAAVTFDRPARFHTPKVRGAGGNIADYLEVSVQSGHCFRYSARVVRNVKIEPSPAWMRARLRAAGVRPINNIVDITNYVMLEYGQPMHAFDYSCLDGRRIVVRDAEEGEAFLSLDDVPHTLKKGMLVIADEKKPVALAGVMGGQNSEITENTRTVVFESACFEGASVRVTSRALGMRTESSGRFEKGLDPETTIPALQRACELVELLGAGEVVGAENGDGSVIDVYEKPWVQTVLPFEPERYCALLGVSLDADCMRSILEKLEVPVRDGKIYVPSFRGDLGCMNDIAEEIIRIYGYDKVSSSGGFVSLVRSGSVAPRQALADQVADQLVSMGLYETCTFSFISPKYYDKIRMAQDDPGRRSVTLTNPLGEDTGIMRTTLLPSILEVLARNNNYHNADTGVFEISAVYIPDEDPSKQPREIRQLAIGFYGAGDFYHLKGILQTVFARVGLTEVIYTAKKDNPTFHPGRCAQLSLPDGTQIGVMGELHPEVAANYGFDKRVLAAVLDFEAIFAHADLTRKYHPLPKYPAATRDLAFVCDEELEAGTIEAVMKKAGGKLLESITLFDVYRGVQIGVGKKNMAFSLSFRAADHTITAEETDKAIKKILTLMDKELGLNLRA